MSITDQLEEERRIINAATAGPWDHQEAFEASFVCAGDAEQSVSNSWVARIENRPGRTKDKADAEFIAHARTALPLRNAQVEMAWEIVELLEQSAATARAAGDVRWQEDATRARMQGMAFAYDDARTALRRAIEEAGA